MIKTWNHKAKTNVKIWPTQVKIQGQDMAVTKVKSKVKIWKSQVQDHEMNESNGKGELCDTNKST